MNKIRRGRRFLLPTLLFVLVATPALFATAAEDPAVPKSPSGDSDTPSDQSDPDVLRRPGMTAPGLSRGPGMQRRGFGPGFGGPPPTTQEVRSALEFAEQQMPNLFELWEDAPSGSPRRGRLGMHAVREYRRWRDLSGAPDQSEAMLHRIKMQDELFALVREYRNAAPEAAPEARRKLRAKMRQVVSQMLEERSQRIERLRRMLEREERALRNEQSQVEDITERRVDMLIHETGPGRLDGALDGPGTRPTDDDPMRPDDAVQNPR